MDKKIVQMLIEKQSFNKINIQLRVSKKRIRKVHEMAKESGYFSGVTIHSYPEIIFEYPEMKSDRPVSDVYTELLK